MRDEKHSEGTSSLHSKETLQADETTYKHDIESQSSQGTDGLDKVTEDQVAADPNIVNWDGPDDPANPMNWSSGKKITAIGIVSLITMLSCVLTISQSNQHN